MGAKEDAIQTLENSAEAFAEAVLGEEVRQGLVDVTDALKEVVEGYATVVTDDLTDDDPNAAALAAAIGNILYGDTTPTMVEGKTPGINVHYTPTIAEGETFDVRNMPRNSHVYERGEVLTNIPDALQTDRGVYVARIPKTASGNVSMFFATGAITGQSFFSNRFIEGSQTTILWNEIPTVTNNDDYDFLYTEFEEEPNVRWWNPTGGHYSVSTGPVTKPIPVKPGQKLYGMWFGGYVPQSCGGAFLNAKKEWVAPVDFPYTNPSTGVSTGGENVTSFAYEFPDVTPGGRDASHPYRAGGLDYSPFWEITVPNNAYYISLNLKTIPDGSNYKYPRSLSTLPIIGETGTGNKIWRKDDPKRAIKKGKRLYIIGPSTLSINRSYRPIYDYDPEDSLPDIDTSELPKGVICGFQEYLKPYYGEVISLAFNGQPYNGTDEYPGIYQWLRDGLYYKGTEGSELYKHDLDDADEVLILMNGNYNSHLPIQIGEETDTDPSTFCGAVNNIIDLIYSLNSGHPVRIYLCTRQNQWDKDDSGAPAYSSNRYNRAKIMNEKIRAIAALKGCALIDEESAGINYHNHKYYSYDSQREIYRGYGGHLNNEGNRIRGNIILNGLLSDGSVFDTSVSAKIEEETAKCSKMEGVLPSGDVQALNGNVFYALSGSNTYTNLPSWAGDTNAKRAGYIQQVELDSASKILIYYSKLYGIGTCVCTGGTWGEWLQIPAAYVPFPTAAEAGNVLTINDDGEYINVAFQTLLGYFLPQPTQADAGKILKVDSNGKYILSTP